MGEAARLRIGLLIPSSNRWTEPQFNRLAPDGVFVHVQRLRMTGPWRRPPREIEADIRAAAQVLSDVRPDVVVFHCTASSMESGPEGEAWVRGVIASEARCRALTTGSAVLQALAALGARRIELFSPYTDDVNDAEVAFLGAAGIEVAAARGLGLAGSDEYVRVPPATWVDFVRHGHDGSVDACFISCTNTQSVDAVAALEESLACPVLTSNQATLWACLPEELRREVQPSLGRLFGRAAPETPGSRESLA